MNRMNEHPDELLAEYVDGSLSSEERAAVGAHLAGCHRCREETALASEARTALRGLPEVAAAGGAAMAVRREARRTPRGGSRAWRAAGAAAVAAALVAGGVVVVNELSQDEAPRGQSAGVTEERRRLAEDQGGTEKAPTAASEDTLAGIPPLVPTYQETDRRYDTSSLSRLGQRLRDQVGASLDAGLAPTATAYFQDFDLSLFTAQIRTALRCVLQEIPPEQLVVPFRVEEASFEGDRVYVAAFLQGPAPDQPYDRVLIWVVGRDDCSLRSLASQRL